MRQRRFMAGILIALFMFWTLGANAIATESKSARRLATGSIVESTTGSGIDVTTGSAIETTTSGGIDVTAGNGKNVTTESGVNVTTDSSIELTSKSAIDLKASGIKISKNKVSYGDAVNVIVNTTTNSAIDLAPNATVCYTTGSGGDEVERLFTLAVEPDGTYRGVLDIEESIQPGIWKVKYILLKDSMGNEKRTFNDSVSSGITRDLSAGNMEVFSDVVDGFNNIEVSNNIANLVDSIGITVSTTANSSADLASEAYVCYSTGNGSEEVEQQLTLTVKPDGTYNGVFSVDESTVQGIWRVKYVIVNDKNGNLQATYNSDVYFGMGRNMSAANILVSGIQIPEYKSISVSQGKAKVGDRVAIEVLTTATSAKELAP